MACRPGFPFHRDLELLRCYNSGLQTIRIMFGNNVGYFFLDLVIAVLLSRKFEGSRKSSENPEIRKNPEKSHAWTELYCYWSLFTVWQYSSQSDWHHLRTSAKQNKVEIVISVQGKKNNKHLIVVWQHLNWSHYLKTCARQPNQHLISGFSASI